jgi:hypothetical protein
VAYGGSDIDVDDLDMDPRVDKRKRPDVPPENKKKIKLPVQPEDRKIKTEDMKIKTDRKIKTEDRKIKTEDTNIRLPIKKDNKILKKKKTILR